MVGTLQYVSDEIKLYSESHVIINNLKQVLDTPPMTLLFWKIDKESSRPLEQTISIGSYTTKFWQYSTPQKKKESILLHSFSLANGRQPGMIEFLLCVFQTT